MAGRKFTATNSYRYGFNGKENDNEVKGEGNQQDYGMRVYDPRLGKFLSVDLLTKDYPWYTPYQFAGNTPIQAIDLDGAEPKGYSINNPYVASHEGTGVKFIPSQYDGQVYNDKQLGIVNAYAIQDIDEKCYLIFESATGAKKHYWYREYDKDGWKGNVNSFEWSKVPDPTNALLWMTVGPLVGLPSIVTGGFLLPAIGTGSGSGLTLRIQYEAYNLFIRYAPTLGTLGRTVAEFLDESGSAGIQNAALRKLAVVATRNSGAAKVMLGKFVEGSASSYERRAGDAYTYFELDHYREIREIVGDDRMWDINRQFIDDAISAGKKVFFSHNPADKANLTGAFKNEVDYLKSKGFDKYKQVGENLWEATNQ